MQQRAVPASAARPRHHLPDEPGRQCLGKRGNGEPLLIAEDRADRPQGLRARNEARAESSISSMLLQPHAAPLQAGLSQPYGVRGTSHANLTRCAQNRQQANSMQNGGPDDREAVSAGSNVKFCSCRQEPDDEIVLAIGFQA